MTFKELDLIEPILNALETKGYSIPTPIQQQAIPIILSGSDIMGCAQTGTGKHGGNLPPGPGPCAPHLS